MKEQATDPHISSPASEVVSRLRKSTDLGRAFPTGVKVEKTDYGLGVFSFAFIPKGTPIGRVRGMVLHDSNYGSDYCIAAGDGIVLEPAAPFCYLNHCCEPNCTLMHYVTDEELDGTEVQGGLEESVVSKDDLYGDENGEADPMDLGDEDECFFGDGGAEVLETEHESEDFDDEDDFAESVNEEENLYNDNDQSVEIWVETVRDIYPGEQLTIDYSWPADRAVKCLCGSPNCRGWIVDPEELDDIEQ